MIRFWRMKMHLKRKLLFAVLLIEIVLLGMTEMQIVREKQSPYQLDFTLDDWNSDLGLYQDGWYADEDMLKTDQPVDFLLSPCVELAQGSYLLTIEYACDQMQTCLPYVGEGSERVLQASLSRL